MKQLTPCLLALLLAAAPGPAWAAAAPYTSSAAPATHLYEQALKHCAQKDLKAATQCLKQALKQDARFVEAYLQLAKIRQKQDDFAGALKLLRRAQRHLPRGQYAALRYELAYLYYRSGAYARAHKVLKKLPPLRSLAPPLHARVARLQQDVAFALTQIKNPASLHPQRLPAPLNQFASQYFPVLTVDQQTLFFTARTAQGHGREDLYVSHKDQDGHWTAPQPLQNINTEHNEGTCAISADGQMLVFTACLRQDNYGMCDLYVTYRKGGEWTTPKNLGPRINSTSWESQPSLSADGKTLYFVSERKGNHGKRDIWKTTLQDDGEWTEPVNLGAPINLSGREVSPCLHPNGQTLFFASDRCPSLGGFDIYYSNYVDGQWTEPVNLGYPVNKHKDQAALFVTADGKKAYYADGSQRGAAYDSSHLYEFDFPPHLLQFPRSHYVKLQVVDAQTDAPIAAQIEVRDLATNTQQTKLQAAADTGEATIVVNEGKEYGLFVSQEGYLFQSLHLDHKQYDDKQAATTAVPQTVRLKPIEAPHPPQVLTNVFFGFDQCTLDMRSAAELDRLIQLLRSHPTLRIAIAGHTDQSGTQAYNQRLSVQRAKAIYDYLVAAGIHQQRLTYQGYGATQPIAPEDTAAGRQRNRRVSFRIIQ